MSFNIPALANNLADSTLDKLNLHYERIRTPQINDPPLMTRESVCERLDLRLAILGTTAYIVEESTDGGPRIPFFAYRHLSAARARACKLVTATRGRAPNGAPQAFLSHGCFTKGGITTTIRSATIGELIDGLPHQLEHGLAVEHQRQIDNLF
jgi:hypothetical protein